MGRLSLRPAYAAFGDPVWKKRKEKKNLPLPLRKWRLFYSPFGQFSTSIPNTILKMIRLLIIVIYAKRIKIIKSLFRWDMAMHWRQAGR